MALAERTAGAVVVGVDGSDASLAASGWAAEQAILENRPLTVLHATGSWSIPRGGFDPGAFNAALRDEGRVVVRDACNWIEERHGVPELRSELLLEDPRAALLEASEHAYLLVVGSRGRGPVKSLLLGSVGIAMTQHARCPLVVRRPHVADAGGTGILVGVDGTKHSEPAVAWAFRQAALREEPLTLLRTVFDGLPAGIISPDDAGHEDLWVQLSEVADRFGRPHPPVEVLLQLRRGLRDEALVQAATGMDTVVIGTHVRRSVLGLFDLDVSKMVVEQAPCFVAIVPASD